MDGGYEKNDIKMTTVMTRLREQAKNAVACDSVTQGRIQVYPLLGKEVFMDILEELDIQVFSQLIGS